MIDKFTSPRDQMTKIGRATRMMKPMAASSHRLSPDEPFGVEAAMRSTSDPRKANIASSVVDATRETTRVVMISQRTGCRKKRYVSIRAPGGCSTAAGQADRSSAPARRRLETA